MKILLLILYMIINFPALSQPEDPGPCFAGWKSETLQRNGRNLNSIIHYPAFSEGSQAPINNIDGPYPVIAFGHGFFMQTSYYLSIFKHLATHGYIVIAPQFPDTQHGELADDLIFCINHIKASNTNPASIFFGLVNVEKTGVSGHSMGGGASLLAASRDSSINVAAPLAAAETNPSAVAVMNLIKGVVYLITGQNDGITPPANHQIPMYNSANPIKGLPIIKGGNHTKFMDTAAFDWTDPRGYRTRAEQLMLTRRYLTAVYNLFLKEQREMWYYAFGDGIETDTMMIFSKELKPLTPLSFNLVSPDSLISPLPVLFEWESSYSLNGEDSVRYILEISTNASFSNILFMSGEIIDTSFTLTELPDGDYYWRVKSKTSESTFQYSNQVFYFGITSTTSVKDKKVLPGDFALDQNYPNPFNPSTLISYTLPDLTGSAKELMYVSLKVFDITGAEITELVSEYQLPGSYSVVFNSDRVGNGSTLTSGVYLYRLNVMSSSGISVNKQFSHSRKMILLR